MSNITQCCTFYVNGLYFGVDVLAVREVVRTQEMTRVPLSHHVIKGLINLRGEIVTAIDLRLLLTASGESQNTDPMNVVIMSDGHPVSLLVDEVGDVVDIDTSRLEEPPDTLDESAKKLVDSVFKMDEGLMLILNVENAVDIRSKV